MLETSGSDFLGSLATIRTSRDQATECEGREQFVPEKPHKDDAVTRRSTNSKFYAARACWNSISVTVGVVESCGHEWEAMTIAHPPVFGVRGRRSRVRKRNASRRQFRGNRGFSETLIDRSMELNRSARFLGTENGLTFADHGARPMRGLYPVKTRLYLVQTSPAPRTVSGGHGRRCVDYSSAPGGPREPLVWSRRAVDERDSDFYDESELTWLFQAAPACSRTPRRLRRGVHVTARLSKMWISPSRARARLVKARLVLALRSRS